MSHESKRGRLPSEPGYEWTAMANQAQRRSKARKRRSSKRFVAEEKACDGAAENGEVDLPPSKTTPCTAASRKCRRLTQGRVRVSAPKFDSKNEEPTLETTQDCTPEEQSIVSALGSTRDARAYSSTRRASHRRLLEETTALHDCFSSEAHHCVDDVLEKHDATTGTRESR